MMAGNFLVIEGLDGSGKTTQTELLAGALRRQGRMVRTLSFPCYGSPASMPVRLYLQGAFGAQAGDVNPYAASAFFAVDRYASCAQDWGVYYRGGGLLLANRYTTANAVHQCAKLPREEWRPYTDWLFDFEYGKMGLPAPDAVLLLDVEPEVSQRLLSERYGGDESKKDIHEKDVVYLTRCRQAAHWCAAHLGWRTVACSQNGRMRAKEEIAGEIDEIAAEVLYGIS